MDIEDIDKQIELIANAINSKKYRSKQTIFNIKKSEIMDCLAIVKAYYFVDKINDFLNDKISYSTFCTMMYRAKNTDKSDTKKHIIKQSLNNKEPIQVTAQNSQNVLPKFNNIANIQFKNEWQSQFNITTERCMKRLEEANLTPDEVRQWDVMGDSAIFRKLAELITAKRKN